MLVFAGDVEQEVEEFSAELANAAANQRALRPRRQLVRIDAVAVLRLEFIGDSHKLDRTCKLDANPRRASLV